MDTRNNMDVGWGLRENVGDDGSVVVDDRLAAEDDQLATRDDELAVDNNRSGARIGKRTDVNDRSDTQASNQADAGPGNGPDADLIIDNAR